MASSTRYLSFLLLIMATYRSESNADGALVYLEIENNADGELYPAIDHCLSEEQCKTISHNNIINITNNLADRLDELARKIEGLPKKSDIDSMINKLAHLTCNSPAESLFINLTKDNIIDHGGVGEGGAGPEHLLTGDGFWNPANVAPWFVTFNFGQRTKVNRVTITNYGDTTHDVTSFSIESSDDNREWTSVASFNKVVTGYAKPQDFSFSGEAQFWKLTIEKTASIYQPFVRYFGFFEDINCVGGVIIGGKCLTFSTDKLSWVDAKKSCSTQNGSLVTLNDPQALKTYVASNYDHQQHFWLGGSDIINEGTWVWLNGQPLGDQFPWHSGEPTAVMANEDCLLFWGGYQFIDAPCDRQYRYVCEKGSHTSA